MRLTLRGLARAPLFTATAILSLALGIGANTAIFSILDQMLLRTLPTRNPRELVFLYHPGPLQGSVSTEEAGDPSFSYPMFRELQKQQTPFTGLAAGASATASLSYKNQASYGRARLVSGNYFDVMGVSPAIGRVFSADDDRTPGAHPVVVLSYGYWNSRFGADPAALNQILLINGHSMTIVGVAQKGFVSEMLGTAPDVFVPITMKKELTPDWNAFDDRRYYWVPLIARLKPGMTLQQAEAAINAAYRPQLEQDILLLNQPGPELLKRFRVKKIILKQGEHGRGGLRDRGKEPLILLMAITALVLLIACANVANLLLARAAARTREMAVRLALGASRGRLIKQLLLESSVISIAGGIFGLIAAYWTVQAIVAALPPFTGMADFLTARLDPRILGYSFGLSVLTGILFGLAPALQASKPNVAPALKDQAGQSTATGSANVFRKSLVTVQIAISLLLLISAGLFGKTLVNLTHIELGMQTDNLLTFSLMPKLNQYTDQRTAIFFEQLTGRLSAIPGVRLVSASRTPAIAGSNSSTSLSVEGYTPQSGLGANNSFFNVVGADYFRTLGIPLIAGREFTRVDTASAPKVALVNEAFVRHFLPNQNPIGRRLSRNSGSNAKFDIEIVGVVKDAKYSDVREAPRRVFYTPYPQLERQTGMFFYVRTANDPLRVVPQVRQVVAALDPDLPIRELKTMQTQLDENLFAERLISKLTGIFAGLATVLAAVGLYGVLAFNVARRTREIGIRMALGASATNVRGLVVKEVAWMLLIGATAGIGSAAALAKFVKTMLYGMEPWDAIVYGASAVVLGLIAVAAGYIPARRATRVDPVTALRYE